MRLGVVMAMKMTVASWAVIPREILDGLPEDGTSMLLRNVSTPSTSSCGITVQETTIIFIAMKTSNLI
jgi:hypothetical protein